MHIPYAKNGHKVLQVLQVDLLSAIKLSAVPIRTHGQMNNNETLSFQCLTTVASRICSMTVFAWSIASCPSHTDCGYYLTQVSGERAELASRLSEQVALLEEEQHSKKKLRKKLSKRLEDTEREVAQLQQKLEDK